MEQVVLEVKNVTKRFPGVLALSNVNFRLSKGKVHALMGENGAGKSTLMKIVNTDQTEHTARRFSAWLPPIQCTLSGHQCMLIIQV